MTESREAPPVSERSPGTKAVRPRDAATLILYRRHGGAVEVLMGERHGNHSFLPNQYVFPGGRVDPSDSRVRVARDLDPADFDRLCRAANPTRARALAAAAIRETFEETGLLIGGVDPEPGKPAPTGWQEFFAHGYAPALDPLRYVVRAVTPPYRHKRFDARFFIADAAHAEGRIKGSGELLDLRWVTLEEALTLDLPRMTAIVVKRIQELIDRPRAGASVTTFIYRHGKHTVTEE